MLGAGNLLRQTLNMHAPASRFALAGAARDGTSGGLVPRGDSNSSRAVAPQHLYGRIKRYKSVEITHIALAVARGDRKERTSERKRRSSHAQERFNTATIFESLLPWLIVQHCLVCAFCARDR